MKRAIVRRLAGRIAVLAVLLFAACSSPAAALDPPTLYVRTGEHGQWMPLAGAHLNAITMELGVALQQSDAGFNQQAYVAHMVSVPDGHPDDEGWDGYCGIAAGGPGSIWSLGTVNYEGNGTYQLEVAAYTAYQQERGDCSGGPSTTASFTVDGRAGAEVVGAPLFVHVNRPGRVVTHGIRFTGPLGTSELDSDCALNAHVNPDGSLSGDDPQRYRDEGAGDRGPTTVADDDESLFTRPGLWTCAARAFGTAGGTESAAGATPWSDPVTALVREPFALIPPPRHLSPLELTDEVGPTYTISGRTIDRYSVGGQLSLTFRTPRRCHDRHRPITVRGRVGSDRRFRLRFRLPTPLFAGTPPGPIFVTAPQRWRADLRFAGTRLVLAGGASFEVSVTAVNPGEQVIAGIAPQGLGCN